MKLRQQILQVAVMLFVFASSPVIAVNSAIDKLNSFVETTVTFQARFHQSVFDSQGRLMEEAEGLFILERPGKFRWDYQQPYPQYIIADGKNIWFYDVDLEQVSVKSQKKAFADTPATLLSGNSLPQDKYMLRDIPSSDGLLWVELIPKDADSTFQVINLAFSELGLSQIIMKDGFDQQTRLVFTQVVENPELPINAFVFTPPKGVDIVGDIVQ